MERVTGDLYNHLTLVGVGAQYSSIDGMECVADGFYNHLTWLGCDSVHRVPLLMEWSVLQMISQPINFA